ncbi:serine/threonine-protein kinase [Streptomyces brasiliscabiei]|uniref:serine/threonine-protein kinase n=2 Tax=Streptomyces TaxID=1883 RepID=UPI001C12930E|nr:serine/threonine-protein kinase [Streptomyces brasiliscabiei]
MSEHVTPADGDDRTATRAQRGTGRLIAGRYLLHEVLGRGGMGTVWRAHDQLLDRPVAAKELHLLAQDEDEHRVRMRRAVREARAVARVPHPHVVGVHDLVEAEDRLWIVMELVEGPSLAHRVAESGPLTPAHTAALGLQMLDALEAVHAAGALHRDVKPANVLLRRGGDAVLTDFGIAALDDGEFLTGTGQLVGSLEYMAPERVTGAESGPASDLWSLGATLVSVCCGQSPFRRPGGPATLHAVAYEEPVLPEGLGPLRPVVEALLRKSPEARPSVAGARSALRLVAAGEPDSGPLPPATVRVPRLSAALADVDTVTSGHERPVRAGETVPTPRGPGSQSARPGGRKPLWWALAGTAMPAAGAVGGLFLAGVLPLREESTTTVAHVVQSATGWQPVNGITVRQGDRITVRFVSGEWTADHRNMPMAGPAGYDAATDARLEGAKDCKVKAAAPFASLLAVLTGDKKFPVHTVGKKIAFRATGDGTLQLGMNDTAGACSEDNRGTLTVKVTVLHRS